MCFTEIYKEKLEFICAKQIALKEMNMLEDPHLFEITPFITFKNYDKINRIMNVTLLDFFNTFNNDDNKDKKNFLCFVSDSRIRVKNMDPYKDVFTFPINDEKVLGVYHINYQNCILFLLDNFTVKVGNYTTKTIDRTITDIDKSK